MTEEMVKRLQAFFAAMQRLNVFKKPIVPIWQLANNDPDLLDPVAWQLTKWSYDEEGKTMFPSLNFKNGFVFTRLEMLSGRDIWNCAALRQKFPKPVPMLTPQRLSVKVMPLCENTDVDARFHLFTEHWCSFTEPTGSSMLKRAEVMLMQRVINSPNIPGSAEKSYFTTVMANDGPNAPSWYFVGYHLPDIPIMEWAEQTYDINALLLEKLKTIFNCDLSLGTVDEISSGNEGFAKKGEMSTAWDYIRHELRVS